MYICSECHRIFEEPTEVKDSRGFYGEIMAYETISFSPCCRDDYYPAEQCQGCGEYFDRDDIDLYDGFCEDCAKNIGTRLEELIALEFNEHEARYIKLRIEA